MEDIKKAHFIGIGGVGMAATAKLLKDNGVEITGSDEAVYPPVSDFLAQEHLDYRTPYTADNIPPDTDFIVIGKNAKLVTETNPEVQAAFDSGKPVLSFPEVLGQLASEQESVVVAGSYGKSTVAALLAHCLEHTGQDPSFFIGAIPYTPSTNAKLGEGELFILEGDEYPSSNTDSRSKFLHLYPSHLLLTPLAHDHVNVFPTPDEYLKPFTELVAQLPEEGVLVASKAGSLSEQFLSSLSRPVITYGVHEGDYHAQDIVWGAETSFTIVHGDEPIVTVQTSQLGEHNVENIVGTAAFLFSQNLLTPEQFKDAIATFKGIRRRLDKKSEKTSIPVYEGFGSSYEKARSAIDAMKLHFPDKRLVVIFEPHTFSWRNRASLSQYDTVFDGVDTVYVFEPASQGADTHDQITQEEIVARVQQAGFDAHAITDPKEAVLQLEQETREDDVVLLLTSGDLGGMIESIPAILEKKFPA